MAHVRTWYKLDNIGTYYAAQSLTQDQTVFRLSATLADDVAPSQLQQALNLALDKYPNFNVSLKNGLFWHYLERRDKPILCEAEQLPICHPLHLQAGAALMRVSYFEKRVNLEISHIVSDGRGALLFFEDLLTAYISNRYSVPLTLPNAPLSTELQKAEDSFTKNYSKVKSQKQLSKAPFRLTSKVSPEYARYLEIHCKTSDVVARAKAYKTTVTTFLIACVIQGILVSEKPHLSAKPLRIGVPVDLRSRYNSKTSRNFFGMSFVDYQAFGTNPSLEDIILALGPAMHEALQDEAIDRRMKTMVKLEKSPAIKLAPSPLKDLGILFGEWWTNRGVTTTVSNLGIAHLPSECGRYVTDINVLTSTKGLNFTAISYGDDFSLTISSKLVNYEVVSCVLQTLRKEVKPQLAHAASVNPEALGELASITTFDHTFPHKQNMMPRRVAVTALSIVTWIAFLVIGIVSLAAQLPLVVPVISCTALWANFFLVRNFVRRSVGFIRATSRYYFVLVALCLLWFATTQFSPVLEIALPIVCLSGLAFDFVLIPVLKSSFIQDYAKYIFFDVALSALPLVLTWCGFAALTPLSIVSASVGAGLLVFFLLFMFRKTASEIRKFFSA